MDYLSIKYIIFQFVILAKDIEEIISDKINSPR